MSFSWNLPTSSTSMVFWGLPKSRDVKKTSSRFDFTVAAKPPSATGPFHVAVVQCPKSPGVLLRKMDHFDWCFFIKFAANSTMMLWKCRWKNAHVLNGMFRMMDVGITSGESSSHWWIWLIHELIHWPLVDPLVTGNPLGWSQRLQLLRHEARKFGPRSVILLVSGIKWQFTR